MLGLFLFLKRRHTSNRLMSKRPSLKKSPLEDDQNRLAESRERARGNPRQQDPLESVSVPTAKMEYSGKPEGSGDAIGGGRKMTPPTYPPVRTTPTPSPRTPILQDAEPVLLGASAPRSAPTSTKFVAHFAAFAESAEDRVQEILAGLSPGSRQVLGAKSCRWQVGTAVKVRLSGNRLKVEEPEKGFTWEGRYNILDYVVEVLPGPEPFLTALHFDVMIRGLCVASLLLDLELRSGEGTGVAVTTRQPSKTAFASYSSQDRREVLKQTRALHNIAGMDFFVDCLSLHPGERYKTTILSEIRNRDLFVLFWSRNAKASKWVDWEWRSAKKEEDEKGRPAFTVQPLEQPSVAVPPKELSHLHFGDPLLFVLDGLDGAN